MPKSRTGPPPNIGFLAHVDACKRPPPFPAMIRGDIYNSINAFAELTNSHGDLVTCAILAALSIVSEAKVQVSPGFKMALNTYIVLTCKSGCGKTPAFSKCFAEPLARLCQEKNISLIIPDLTTGGLMKFLQANECRGTISQDELSLIFEKFFSGDSSVASLKVLLNTLHSNQSYAKYLASGQGVRVDNPFVCMFGMIQPSVLLNHLYVLMDDDCGFLARLILLSVGRFKKPESASFLQFMEHRKETFVEDFVDELYCMYLAVYDYFHENTIVLQLSTNASLYAHQLQVEQREAHDEIYREYEALLELAASAPGGDGIRLDQIPEPDLNPSKTFDNIVKSGVLMHILHAAWNVKTVTELRHRGTINIVDTVFLKRGSMLVDAARNQLKVYVKTRDQLVEKCSPKRAVRIQKPTIDTLVETQRKILLFPGPVVSVRMFKSLHRVQNLESATVRSGMDSMATGNVAEFVGKSMTSQRNTLFIKASPDEISQVALQIYGITLTQFRDAYETKIPTLSHTFKTKDEFVTHLTKMTALANNERNRDTVFDSSQPGPSGKSSNSLRRGRVNRRLLESSDSDDSFLLEHEIPTVKRTAKRRAITPYSGSSDSEENVFETRENEFVIDDTVASSPPASNIVEHQVVDSAEIVSNKTQTATNDTRHSLGKSPKEARISSSLVDPDFEEHIAVTFEPATDTTLSSVPDSNSDERLTTDSVEAHSSVIAASVTPPSNENSPIEGSRTTRMTSPTPNVGVLQVDDFESELRTVEARSAQTSKDKCFAKLHELRLNIIAVAKTSIGRGGTGGLPFDKLVLSIQKSAVTQTPSKEKAMYQKSLEEYISERHMKSNKRRADSTAATKGLNTDQESPRICTACGSTRHLTSQCAAKDTCSISGLRTDSSDKSVHPTNPSRSQVITVDEELDLNCNTFCTACGSCDHSSAQCFNTNHQPEMDCITLSSDEELLEVKRIVVDAQKETRLREPKKENISDEDMPSPELGLSIG